MSESPLRLMNMPASAGEQPAAASSGWWVVLDYIEHPMAFGPYESEEQAIAAMQDSLLIDAQCCDTTYPDTLDDCYVPDRPGTVAGMCEAYGPDHVFIIDPHDADHHGRRPDGYHRGEDPGLGLGRLRAACAARQAHG